MNITLSGYATGMDKQSMSYFVPISQFYYSTAIEVSCSSFVHFGSKAVSLSTEESFLQ